MQFDIRVTLERIEFAAEETRLLFVVENGRDEPISAIGTGVRVRRGDAEFRAVFPTGHGVPPPGGRVEVGGVERGWFQFPPLERAGPAADHHLGRRTRGIVDPALSAVAMGGRCGGRTATGRLARARAAVIRRRPIGVDAGMVMP